MAISLCVLAVGGHGARQAAFRGLARARALPDGPALPVLAADDVWGALRKRKHPPVTGEQAALGPARWVGGGLVLTPNDGLDSLSSHLRTGCVHTGLMGKEPSSR